MNMTKEGYMFTTIIMWCNTAGLRGQPTLGGFHVGSFTASSGVSFKFTSECGDSR